MIPLALWLLLPQEVWGQGRVAAIELEGVRSLPQERVFQTLAIRKGQLFQEVDLLSAMETAKNLYYSEGFLWTLVEASITGSPDVRITFKIREGRRAVLGEIDLVGASLFSREDLESGLGLRRGRFFKAAELGVGIERVLEMYETAGYPYCQLNLKNFELSGEGRVDFTLQIVEGPSVTVEEIEFAGLVNTRQHVLQREMEISPGELYNSEKIDRSLLNLNRLSFIRINDKPQIFALAEVSRGRLTIPVKEIKASRAEAALGYSPGQGEASGYLTGLLDFHLVNLFGTGREGKVRWFRRDPHSSELEFSYLEPYILGTRLNVKLQVSQVDFDSTYIRNSVGIDLDSRLTYGVAAGAGFSLERTNPESWGRGFLPSETKTKGRLLLTLDFRDDSNNPRAGSYFSGEAGYASKRNSSTNFYTPEVAKENITSASGLGEYYLPLGKRRVLAARAFVGGVGTSAGRLPVTEEIYMGGLGTLRGYRQDQFSGRLIFWSNLEFRFLPDMNSRLFLFFDSGYFSKETSEGWRYGYGLGFRLASKLGNLAFDLGIPWEEGFSQAKVHFGVANSF
jgi:outer membrane protein assembly factor BamA